ncbi:hypothetical protein [Fortiea contorta]|uniref:hypothetical protein n=1 Tax=Fortiea contorta TaxID=1892405 RepID=UPI000348931C|nr:hypothetical protein [Fortiea contorta]
MSTPESIAELVKWIQNFDYRFFPNLDDIYPGWQDLLAKYDFQPAIIKEDDRLIVVQPKVAIACNLPQFLKQGDCQIEFSNLFFRGLKISLNHHNILTQLMIGLNTQPNARCRPFIQQLTANSFEVSLGQTTVILSAIETTDLCSCIDIICQAYKTAIVEFENNLETWELKFIEFGCVRGFHLFAVEQPLWELMYKFANEFDYIQGKSAWHIFHQEDASIRISRGIRDHAFICPQIDSFCALGEKIKINILYVINEVHFQSLTKAKNSLWSQSIGTRGTWTAKYTKEWLLNKYIPTVIEYYAPQNQSMIDELQQEIINFKFAHLTIQDINDIPDLLPYLRDIQVWLNIHQETISTVLLHPYYQAFTDLIRHTDSAIAGIEYILGNLRHVARKSLATEQRTTRNLKTVLSYLDEQVDRINNCEVESSHNANAITRIFIWIIENGNINFSQAQINLAKQALLPLWEQSRFEMRYVYLHSSK